MDRLNLNRCWFSSHDIAHERRYQDKMSHEGEM